MRSKRCQKLRQPSCSSAGQSFPTACGGLTFEAKQARLSHWPPDSPLPPPVRELTTPVPLSMLVAVIMMSTLGRDGRGETAGEWPKGQQRALATRP